jgi:hypothetical protein
MQVRAALTTTHGGPRSRRCWAACRAFAVAALLSTRDGRDGRPSIARSPGRLRQCSAFAGAGSLASLVCSCVSSRATLPKRGLWFDRATRLLLGPFRAIVG